MLCILFSFVQRGGREKSLSIQLKISFRSSLSRFLNENFKPGLNSFWCYSWAIFLGLLEIENFLFLIVLFVFKFFFFWSTELPTKRRGAALWRNFSSWAKVFVEIFVFLLLFLCLCREANCSLSQTCFPEAWGKVQVETKKAGFLSFDLETSRRKVLDWVS